jgi:hypothetical protein
MYLDTPHAFERSIAVFVNLCCHLPAVHHTVQQHLVIWAPAEYNNTMQKPFLAAASPVVMWLPACLPACRTCRKPSATP